MSGFLIGLRLQERSAGGVCLRLWVEFPVSDERAFVSAPFNSCISNAKTDMAEEPIKPGDQGVVVIGLKPMGRVLIDGAEYCPHGIRTRPERR